jgi:hypothetical protein
MKAMEVIITIEFFKEYPSKFVFFGKVLKEANDDNS